MAKKNYSTVADNLMGEILGVSKEEVVADSITENDIKKVAPKVTDVSVAEKRLTKARKPKNVKPGNVKPENVKLENDIEDTTIEIVGRYEIRLTKELDDAFRLYKFQEREKTGEVLVKALSLFLKKEGYGQNL